MKNVKKSRKSNYSRVLPQVVPTPSRYRNPIGKYMVKRNANCTNCGLCAKLCPHGVHLRYENYTQPT